MLFKEKIGLKIVGDGASRERRLRRRGSDSLVRRRSSRISGKFYLKLASIEATIGPRSRRDRATIVDQS